MKLRGDWLGLLAAILVVLICCGMAMRATGRDNECAALGGHIEGIFEMRCVTP